MKLQTKLLFTALAVLPLAGCVVDEYPVSNSGTTDVYYSNVTPSTGSGYTYRTENTQVTATPAAPAGASRRTVSYNQPQPAAVTRAMQTPAAPAPVARKAVAVTATAPAPAAAPAPTPVVATVVSTPAAPKPATTATTVTPQAPTT